MNIDNNENDASFSLVNGFLCLASLVCFVIYVACTTYAEFNILMASGTQCETSSCARSMATGLLFFLPMMPVGLCFVVITFCGLLALCFKWAQEQVDFAKIFFLTFFPFGGTSLVFLLATTMVIEPGYLTEVRFLMITLVKMVLLPLNFIIYFICVLFFFKLNWHKVFKISLPFLLVCCWSYQCNYSEAEPYFHYLGEERTYDLAHHYLLDVPVYREYCSATPDGCVHKLLPVIEDLL